MPDNTHILYPPSQFPISTLLHHSIPPSSTFLNFLQISSTIDRQSHPWKSRARLQHQRKSRHPTESRPDANHGGKRRVCPRARITTKRTDREGLQGNGRLDGRDGDDESSRGEVVVGPIVGERGICFSHLFKCSCHYNLICLSAATADVISRPRRLLSEYATNRVRNALEPYLTCQVRTINFSSTVFIGSLSKSSLDSYSSSCLLSTKNSVFQCPSHTTRHGPHPRLREPRTKRTISFLALTGTTHRRLHLHLPLIIP